MTRPHLPAHLSLIAHFFASALCTLLAAFTLCGALAADLVAIPRATSLIVDQVGLLTDAERSGIGARLKRIQDTGRAQIGILISTGTGDEAMAPYALRVAEAWRLGGKEDDSGLLILIVPSENAARIEVGYGLEGAIPDARAAGYVRDYLRLTQPGSATADQPGNAAAALNVLLDNIVALLPPKSFLPRGLTKFVKQHTEWEIPIVMLILSVFTLFPLLFTSVFSSTPGGTQSRAFPSARVCIAAFFSAVLFAAALGFAGMTFWNAPAIGYKAAAVAFTLPLLWSLNVCHYDHLGLLARIGYIVGNVGLFAYIFATLTIVGGAVLYVENVKEIWIAPLFGLLFTIAPLAFILDERVGRWLFKIAAYLMFFAVALAIAYFALQDILKDPTRTAVTVAAIFTVLTAIGFTLDNRESSAHGNKGDRRWAWMFTAAGVLFLLPFMVVAFAHAMLGNVFTEHFAIFMAGDGTFSEFVWWVSGALGGSALLVGLGGKFGGGGAGSG